MPSLPKPSLKPADPNFGSGPCKKRPGYSLESLKDAPLGRSHRSELGLGKLKKAIKDTHEVLQCPPDYLVAIVPASDTGAVEMAMWSMLGSRPVDVCFWEAFGEGWFADIMKELKLPNVTKINAPYGKLPDFSVVDPTHDVVFTWNGTTSGVKVPNADWISDQREGITICDATSAVFAMEMPWKKLDVVTFSWQKVLGGEAAHGMIVLSPRAVERLQSYVPPWPVPKIYRMTKGGKLNKDLFEGSVINTVSMLCVEDYLDALQWAKSIGGLPALLQRSADNLDILTRFVDHTPWIHFLAADPSYKSNTSVCFTLDLSPEKLKAMTKLLASEGVAYDIGSYRDAPPGLRIWCGATVEKGDLEALTHWLLWAYNEVQ
mmetsp:Transcript_23733/g.40873  ORF Transcript_23733/g.40873 Transcript_23733/m.40873 type:complete len:375 (+) Transcript_23733:130-1254(+)|eukprot:CAMPEP_0196661626 /NCGR_PEP_ID=MMETSP1086-20130531/45268_1 /TAXON_ID=77921 /ORGANISM="Cyanoptyche  gloeocystis , Strain SAG4.97" /LENGTH=374 /DNA_ID=CAMNT_0041996623 /DNA_START=130 /DNA_END=1254 /DNA_ORIENTATION=+